MKAGKGGSLSLHETTIIGGALELTAKTARDAMTPLSQIFSVDINAKLDRYHTLIINTSSPKLHSYKVTTSPITSNHIKVIFACKYEFLKKTIKFKQNGKVVMLSFSTIIQLSKQATCF